MPLRPFGTTPDGRPVEIVTLTAGGMSARFLTLGARLQDLRIAGVDHSLTVGSDDVTDYTGRMRYHGAVVGPVANRIAGASFDLDDERHETPANDGPNTLHGGPEGTHDHIWTLASQSEDRVTFVLMLEDGAEGYPGTRQLVVRYRLLLPNTLEMVLDAETDAPTLMNLANHSYWCLGPDGLVGHKLDLFADNYLPTDAGHIPTGVVAPVARTPFDYRRSRPVGPEADGKIDHNFCLADRRRSLQLAARLVGPTGTSMVLETTEPGLQIYDAHRNEPAFEGLAMEPQCWPDAPHRPKFPSIELMPGESYRQVTHWTFSA